MTEQAFSPPRWTALTLSLFYLTFIWRTGNTPSTVTNIYGWLPCSTFGATQYPIAWYLPSLIECVPTAEFTDIEHISRTFPQFILIPSLTDLGASTITSEKATDEMSMSIATAHQYMVDVLLRHGSLS